MSGEQPVAEQPSAHEARLTVAREAAAELERHARSLIDSANLFRTELGKPPLHIRAAARPRRRGDGT